MKKLCINDPDFIAKFREAIGVKPGEKVEFVTPQFERTDGKQVPIPQFSVEEFERLHTLCEDVLRELGLQLWDEKGPWLFPAEWYDFIPEGLEVLDINMQTEKFSHGQTDDDRRYGALPYGFARRPGQSSN